MNQSEFSTALNSFFLVNIQKFASDMQIAFEIDKAIAGNQHPICLGIKKCIADKLPMELILSNIRSMATVNFSAIADHLGISLTEKIMKG